MTKMLKLLPCLFLACCGVVATAATQAAAPAPPILQEAALPLYPVTAQLARVTGNITVRVTVKNGEVTNTVVASKLDQRLLETITVENLKTWRFAPEVNGEYTVTYTYELSGEYVEQPTNARVEMLPSLDARITARPVKRTIMATVN